MLRLRILSKLDLLMFPTFTHALLIHFNFSQNKYFTMVLHLQITRQITFLRFDFITFGENLMVLSIGIGSLMRKLEVFVENLYVKWGHFNLEQLYSYVGRTFFVARRLDRNVCHKSVNSFSFLRSGVL